MSIDRVVPAFAGLMILAGLLLGLHVSPNWYWCTAFTGFCPMALILRRLGVQPGAAF